MIVFRKQQMSILILSISFFIVILTNGIAFCSYYEMVNIKQSLYRKFILRQVISEATALQKDSNSFQEIINKINNPKDRISVTKAPIYSIRIKNIKYKTLENNIPHDLGVIDFSLKIKRGFWINYHINLRSLYYVTKNIFLLFLLIQTLVISILIWYAHRFSQLNLLFDHIYSFAKRLGIPVSKKHKQKKTFSQFTEIINTTDEIKLHIQMLLKERIKFLGNISHDLKTPITRLKLQASFINDEILSNEISQELDELNLMINQIINYARFDPIDEKIIKVDIVSLLQTICDDFSSQNNCINFTADTKRAILYARLITLKRAFTNLVSNGVKYSETVKVNLISSEEKYIITINDNGPGIPIVEINDVLKPFYRSKTNSKIHGSGLGLAITKEAIDVHHGKLILENNVNGGLCVTVILTRNLI